MAEVKYDIVPKNAVRFAEDVITTIKRIDDVELDLSVESLNYIDSVVERFRKEGVDAEDVAATLFSFGCYVGEVFVRYACGRWRKPTKAEADMFGQPLVVELSNGVVVNPIGKVFGRLTHGEEDNLFYFYRAYSVKPTK